jgi:hypothetical protein
MVTVGNAVEVYVFWVIRVRQMLSFLEFAREHKATTFGVPENQELTLLLQRACGRNLCR